MPVAMQADQLHVLSERPRKLAVKLLSQQIWCWGQDILRPEGNWLVEIGFQRVAPPKDRESCSSVYTLELSPGRRVVLRGFGIFYGDDALGGVFLPRFEFGPKYTTHAALARPPWSEAELPERGTPSAAQRTACASLTLALIEWIRDYEVTIAERLGIDYRQSTLVNWNNGKRKVVPAAEMASAWRLLGLALTADLETLIPQK